MAKPRILLLIDVFGWAFHALAKGIASHASDAFDFDIVPMISKQEIDYDAYDLVHIFGVRSMKFNRKQFKKCIVLKSLFNTIFKEPNETTLMFYEKYISDADGLTVPTLSMLNDMQGIPTPIFLTPEGVNCTVFHPNKNIDGPLRIGWAGNPSKAYKRFSMAYEASRGMGEFRVADGTLSEEEMVRFYNDIDVILCTSRYGEGCPRPLLEGAACGCFAVSFPVGVAPEMIVDKENGIIVRNETADSVRNALTYCESHLSQIRAHREKNAAIMAKTRDWNTVNNATVSAYRTLLS